MINLPIQRHALALRVSLALAAVVPAAAMAAVSTTTAAPDSGLFTTYSIGPGYHGVNWLVCGSTQQTEGCYVRGTMGKFGQVAAMIEGAARVNAATGTVTREIYVCDVAAGSSGTDVTLYDYTKTDVVSATDDAATVVLKKAIPTTLVGGANATCQIGASPLYLYVSVNGGIVIVSKIGDFVLEGGTGLGITSVTADGPGFVDIDNSNDQFSDTGGFSGGGNYFKVAPGVGTNLMKVPMFYGTFPASRMKVVPKRHSTASAATTNAPIDANLVTDYYVFSPGSISFVVCGSTQQTEGCFGGGGFGPFHHNGSIMEGYKTYNGGTVTRHVYVCDDAAGGGTGVTLYDYKRTDVIDSSYDNTTVTLVKNLPLPLVGGANANCAMAEDHGNVFVGTQNGNTAVKVDQSNYQVVTSAGQNLNLPFATATANSSGFVATTFGSTSGTRGTFPWSADVKVFGSTGNPVQSNLGAYFLLNTSNAVQTASLPPTTAAVSDSLMSVRFKQLPH